MFRYEPRYEPRRKNTDRANYRKHLPHNDDRVFEMAQYNSQRQHVAHSLDALLYHLHTLSFFLSPSLFAYVCRLVAQNQCSKIRVNNQVFNPRLSILFIFCLNLPCVWSHIRDGALTGRVLVLDFVGLACDSSRLHLVFLDFTIFCLQLILFTATNEYAESSVNPPTSYPAPILDVDLVTVLSVFKSSSERRTGPGVPLVLTLYFFYWNRLAGLFLTIAIRLLTWDHGDASAWAKIGSVHCSLVAGRILLKDVQYSSSNQTLRIVKARLSWRWWIRSATSEEDLNHSQRVGEEQPAVPEDLCRIQMSLQGLEWFIYNRTRSFDNILSGMFPGESMDWDLSSRSETSPGQAPSVGLLRVPLVVKNICSWLRSQLPNLDAKDVLPLRILANKGAVICGNSSTPSLLLLEFKCAEGTFGIAQSRSKLDQHKQALNLKLVDALVRYAKNRNHGKEMTAVGEEIHFITKALNHLSDSELLSKMAFSGFKTMWKSFGFEQRSKTASILSGCSPSIAEQDGGGCNTKTQSGCEEYAKEERLLEAAVVELSYYADVAGKTPRQGIVFVQKTGKESEVGDLLPEWGLNVLIHGATIRFGPWADRQRAHLQKAFFPPTYQNIQPSPSLKPGDVRMCKELNVLIEFRGESVLHIPFRETSRWPSTEVHDSMRPANHEPGTLHFKLDDGATLWYILPMIVDSSGYESRVDVHLKSVTVTTSLNDTQLISTQSCHISGRLPSPLKWSDNRTWSLEAVLDKPKFFVLRDHINMLSDLGKDWASGPPHDYFCFVPVEYKLLLSLHQFEINLYANDLNIIDKPLAEDENTLFSIRGRLFSQSFSFPSNVFRPEATNITFDSALSNPSVAIRLPRWNTHSMRLPKQGFNVLCADVLHLRGSYLYHSESSGRNVDQLLLYLEAPELTFRLFGWSIRQVMVLRENFLGQSTRFSTLLEFLQNQRNNLSSSENLTTQFDLGQSSPLNVELNLSAKSSLIVIPATLAGNEKATSGLHIGPCVLLKISHPQFYLRTSDSEMEMSVVADCLLGQVSQVFPAEGLHSEPDGKHAFAVDGLMLRAHRLFGPRPRGATYVCVWEARFGGVNALVLAEEIDCLLSAVSTFKHSYLDVTNAPAFEYLPSIDPDATFFKIVFDKIQTTWIADTAALELSIPYGATITTNDLSGKSHRSVASFHVLLVSGKLLLPTNSDTASWLEVGCFETDCAFDLYSTPSNSQIIARAQSKFIKEQDSLTCRAAKAFSGLFPDNMLRKEGSKNPAGDPSSCVKNRSFFSGLPDASELDASKPTHSHSKTRQTKQLWWSKPSLQAESEQEGVSKVDRNARLTQVTKTAIKSARPFEEQDISSGDESDNEDLTDRESDGGQFSSGCDSSTEFSEYFFCSRHFARRLSSETLPSSSAFVLSKDLRPSKFLSVPSASEKRRVNAFVQLLEIPVGLATSGFRLLRLRIRSLELALLPLAAKACANLAKELWDENPKPGLFLNSLVLRRLDFFLPIENTTTQVVVDLEVKQLYVRLFLQVMHPAHSIPTAFLGTGFTSCVDVSGSTLSAKIISSTGKPPKVGFGLDQLNMALGRVTSLGDPASAAEILVIRLDHLWAGTSSTSQLTIGLEKGVVELSSDSPSRVSLFAEALDSSIRNGIDELSSCSKRRARKSSETLFQILSCSKETPFFDLLSAIQPSYLVQSGLPQRLRTDDVLRFLDRLLHSIEHRSLTGDSFSHSPASITTEEELTTLLGNCAVMMGLDLKTPSEFMSFFVNRSTSIMRNPPSASPLKVMFNAALLSFIAWDVQKSTHSSLHMRSVGIIFQTQTVRSQNEDFQLTIISVALKNLGLSIFPHMMLFTHQLLCSASSLKMESATRHIYARSKLNATLQVDELRIRAAAENLVLDSVSLGLHGSSAWLRGSGVNHLEKADQSWNSSFLFDHLSFRALSPSDISQKPKLDVLASLTLKGGHITALVRQERSKMDSARALSIVDGVHLTVPRSALRLLRFIDSWRADFLPGLQQSTRVLVSEIKIPKSPTTSPSSSQSTRKSTSLQFYGLVTSLNLALKVMRGTWLSWEVERSSTFYKQPSMQPRIPNQSFGIQLSSQQLNISTERTEYRAPSNSSRALKLDIPPVTAVGRRNESNILLLTSVDFLSFKIKPAYWDTILTVQQKFGNDFNDLVSYIRQARRNIDRNSPSNSSFAAPPKMLQLDGFIKMRGFRVALEGVTSVLFLECEDIIGGASNGQEESWHFRFSDLALSLTPRGNAASFKHRPVFVAIDAQSRNKTLNGNHTLHVTVTKIHAVMQPSSIGQVGDFVDHLRGDLTGKKEQRALKLAAFKEKTKRIMETFENQSSVSNRSSSSRLCNYSLQLSVKNMGVAFPLTLNQVGMNSRCEDDSPGARAFLLSLATLKFDGERGKSGQLSMKSLSFQFVQRFRQSIPADFSARNHVARNRLVFPEIISHLLSRSTSFRQEIRLTANILSFDLDLDSSVPDYVFSLVDVYREGRERFERLATTGLVLPDSHVLPSNNPLRILTVERKIFGILTFSGGNVCLIDKAASASIRREPSEVLRRQPGEYNPDIEVEIFKLPPLSAWVEYRAICSPDLGFGFTGSSSVLLLKTTIHESHNTLKPSILPFATELVGHIDTRFQKIGSQESQPSVCTSQSMERKSEKDTNILAPMHICFTLRIDRSRLELTCQPDVNVIGGLHWDSGGFCLQISPGARKVTLSGTVGGLAVGLKHGFLSDESVRLDARNLTLSVNFSTTEEVASRGIFGCISVVIEADFSGAMRFSRFQDILCFKAVWLDRIPITAAQTLSEIGAQNTPAPRIDPISTKFRPSVGVLIQLRQMVLEVDLGQSITVSTLEIRNVIVRSQTNTTGSEFLLSVAGVDISARGNISGFASVPNCVFKTVKKSEWHDAGPSSGSKMLELYLTSDTLDICVDSDNQVLLLYRAEPLDIRVFDDWSDVTLEASTDHPLRLSFTVYGSEISSAITVSAIPKLVAYAEKFQMGLDAQREGASRESRAFRSTRSPKPDNPLSSVANAMIRSARSRFRESDSGFSYAVHQHLSLQLQHLRLSVFPRALADPEMAQFVGRDIRAQLERVVVTGGASGERDLQLSFSSMTISKLSQLGRVQTPGLEGFSLHGKRWDPLTFADVPEATIVGLPSMKIHMRSDESLKDEVRMLGYDFHSNFVRREGTGDLEDIYISLNMSLYSWLTVLRKNLSREMEQAQRTSIGSLASPTQVTRKKQDHQLGLPNDETSPQGAPDDPHSPSDRRASLKITKPPSIRTDQLMTGETSVTTSSTSGIPFPSDSGGPASTANQSRVKIDVFHPKSRFIERLTMRQLGEATPDVMHPFFMKKAGFNLEDSFPQYIHEYATIPLEEVMALLLKLYSKQMQSAANPG